MTGKERHDRIRELTQQPCVCTGQCGTRHNSGRGGPCRHDPSLSHPNIAAPAEPDALIGPVNMKVALVTWCPDCYAKALKIARTAREAAARTALEEAQESLF